MQKIFIHLVLMLLFSVSLEAQESGKGWDRWQFLMGNWKGEGGGNPGQGSGLFSFNPDLDGNILVRKSRTEFPANGNSPATVHQDLMIVYSNPDGNPAEAIYFDNERHIIHYEITYQENKIVLTSKPGATSPRFRLVYEKLDNALVNTRFEMAMPNAPDDFKLYIEGKSRKAE